jgi:hypothetical protein
MVRPERASSMITRAFVRTDLATDTHPIFRDFIAASYQNQLGQLQVAETES